MIPAVLLVSLGGLHPAHESILASDLLAEWGCPPTDVAMRLGAAEPLFTRLDVDGQEVDRTHGRPTGLMGYLRWN